MEMLRSLRGDKHEFCLTVIKFKHVNMLAHAPLQMCSSMLEKKFLGTWKNYVRYLDDFGTHVEKYCPPLT